MGGQISDHYPEAMIRQHAISRRLVCMFAALLLAVGVTVAVPEQARAQGASVRLSEVVSVNSDGLVDAYGSSSDWIEIENTSAAPFDLGGWGLSDKQGEPLQWVFPAGTAIEPGDYLVVFASGEASVGDELHAGFSIAGSGEWLGLAMPDGTVVSSMQVPALLPNHSYGVTSAGSLGVFSAPTPGAANGAGAAGLLDDPVVSPARGFFSAPVQVDVSHPDPAVTLRYTTDGSAPTATTGQVVAGPLTVATSTTLRVAAFRDGWLSERPVTHSYLFAAGVPDQPVMDPSWAGDPVLRQRIIDGVNALPAVSLVTEDPIPKKTDVRVSVEPAGLSIEWIDPAGGPGFQVDGAAKEVGGYSIRNPKDSWRLSFDSEWGESSLEFPVFDGFPSDGLVPAADVFKRLTLRAGAHDTFFWLRDVGQSSGRGTPAFTHYRTWLKGRWGDETMLELGHVNTHGRWVNVFVNGEYWGQYHVREHFDDHFMASYFGGDNSAYVGVNRGAVASGSGDGWDAAIAAAGSWTTWREHVDPVAYIDWMLLNEYQGNFWDLGVNWNHRGAGQATAGDGPGFIFHGSDQDITLDTPDEPMKFPGPAGSWTNLLAEAHPEFVALVNDRAQALLLGDGELATAAAQERWDRLSNEIEVSMYAEFARWGFEQPDAPFGEWTAEASYQMWTEDIAYVRNVVLPARPQLVLDRLDSYGILSELQAPVLPAGEIISGTVVSVENPNPDGELWVTFDGSDPRSVDGAVGATAVAGDPTVDFVLDLPVTVLARVRHNGEWSPLTQRLMTPLVNPAAPVVEASRSLTSVQGFSVRHQIVASDPSDDSLTFSVDSAPDGVGIDAGSGVLSGVPSTPGDTEVVVRVSDGQHTTAMAFDWSIVAHDGPPEVAVVLNEYNAVKSSELLDGGAADPAFGAVRGNGGDWIELLATEDGVDLRGWSIELWDRENGPLELRDTIVFSDAPVLAQVMSGTIITIAESQPEDASYDPRERDWTINARSATGIASSLVTDSAGNFDSNRHSFRVRIRDAAGISQSPFMGETDTWRSFGNVGGNEVFARCDTPDPAIHPADGDPRDTTLSTFGQPNDCGDVMQDLVSDRDGFRGDADCDGEITVVDALAIARYGVSNAGPVDRCDGFAAGQAFVVGGDFNDDGATNVIDGLLVSQCVVGIDNDFCHD